jgi:hypothetical protein
VTATLNRADGLEVREVPDGFVVYHPARDRVHYLNHTAALVLELCTGAHTASGLAAIVQRAYDLPEPPEAEVGACVAQLRDEGLVW